jgi:hypothetical protein
MIRHEETELADSASVTIRRLSEAERSRVKLIAELDSMRVPEAPWLGAEVDGRVLAVISLASGETVADPFSRTAELRAMLELRAAQLRRPANGRPNRTRRRGRATLAGSPPGAGGRLLTLLPRS